MVREWIPTSERLPEENGNYLACCDDGYITDLWYDQDKGWLMSGTVIVAWMRLPDPYTGKDEYVQDRL